MILGTVDQLWSVSVCYMGYTTVRSIAPLRGALPAPVLNGEGDVIVICKDDHDFCAAALIANITLWHLVQRVSRAWALWVGSDQE